MTEQSIVNPSIPYLAPLRSTIVPGKFIRIIGTVSSVGKEFYCNLQCGPSSYDDIAVHISVKPNEGVIVTKAQEFGTWKEENLYDNSPIARGKEFEILIICELTVFKIGVNGQHLCEFPHKLPYNRISYIKIEGDLSVSHISVESQPTAPLTDQSKEMNSPPPPYGAATPVFPPVHSQPVPPQVGPPQGSYPLNSGYPSQTFVYANQPPPPGLYAYNSIGQPGVTVAALNATPRAYQRPFFSRPYYGNRKMAYFAFALFGVFTLISLTIFLIMFFKGQREFDEARKRQQEFRNNF